MRQNRRFPGKKARRPKMKLGLPDLDQSRSAVLNSLRSPGSQRGCGIPSMSSSLGTGRPISIIWPAPGNP